MVWIKIIVGDLVLKNATLFNKVWDMGTQDMENAVEKRGLYLSMTVCQFCFLSLPPL